MYYQYLSHTVLIDHQVVESECLSRKSCIICPHLPFLTSYAHHNPESGSTPELLFLYYKQFTQKKLSENLMKLCSFIPYLTCIFQVKKISSTDYAFFRIQPLPSPFPQNISFKKPNILFLHLFKFKYISIVAIQSYIDYVSFKCTI